MANPDSPQKLAMDAKLARVWTHENAPSAAVVTRSYGTKLTPERIKGLEAESIATANRVFRSLRSP